MLQQVKNRELCYLYWYALFYSVCPIFTMSNVTGHNIDLIIKFLNVLPPLHSTKERQKFMQELAEHQVHCISVIFFFYILDVYIFGQYLINLTL